MQAHMAMVKLMLEERFTPQWNDEIPSKAAYERHNAAVNAWCHRQGVVTLTAGTYGNVLRFLPPLSAPDELLTEALDILEQAFVALA